MALADDLNNQLDSIISDEPQGDSEDTVQNFKLGEEEYSQEQLEELVNFGKLAKEAEEKYNTKIDKVWPEFTKKSQAIKEYETKIAEYEEQLKQRDQQFSPEDQEQIDQAKEAARKIGLLTKDDLKDLGMMTKDDFEAQYARVSQAQKLLDDMGKYSKEVDGSDGRPKFDVDDMLNYMQDTGIQDFKLAYKVRYDDELTSWKESQLNKAKKPGLYTEKTSTMGEKMPIPDKLDRNNLKDHVRQAMEGSL